MKVAVWAGAHSALDLATGTSSEASQRLGGRSSLPTFTQQASSQTVLDAWVPGREVAAVGQ